MELTVDIQSAIGKYLLNRPIGPVFGSSDEKDHVKALQMMCIFDREMEKNGLYDRISKTNHKKLLVQLMNFRSFASFQYYNYVNNKKDQKEMAKKILQCKFCDLVGPYNYVLSHMAINHDAHIGLKVCAYCNRKKLKEHFTEKSFNECYENYIDTHKITVNFEINKIVADFFTLLKDMGRKFNVLINRRDNFAGIGRKKNAPVAPKYGKDFPTNCIVFFQHRANLTEINNNLLQREFNDVFALMQKDEMFKKYLSRKEDENTIILTDDDDDEEECRTNDGSETDTTEETAILSEIGSDFRGVS